MKNMVNEKERVPVVEVGREPEIVPETKIERLEKEQYILKKPVLDDQTGQVLVTAPNVQSPVVILPLTNDEYKNALSTEVSSSIRWLAEWSKRLMKMLGRKVEFRQN